MKKLEIHDVENVSRNCICVLLGLMTLFSLFVGTDYRMMEHKLEMLSVKVDCLCFVKEKGETK